MCEMSNHCDCVETVLARAQEVEFYCLPLEAEIKIYDVKIDVCRGCKEPDLRSIR